MIKVIISGGGTGGHIYPALTIVEEIKRLDPEAQFLYIGSKNGLESKIAPQENIPFTTIEIQSLARKMTMHNVATLFKSTTALVKATKMIRSFKPNVVIGTGGYVCGPVLLAAALMGVPTLIQEQNVIGGVTNKILSRFVDTVALGYEDAQSCFTKCKHLVYTGNPVRPQVMEVTREEGRAFFHVEDNEFVVLVAGGSRGARSINTAMIDVHKHFKDKEHIKFIHVTGTGEFSRVLASLELPEGEYDEITYGKNSLILPYMHNMPKALSAADLAIFRAGAVGLAELTAKGIPSILIPYPYAAEDHQTYNAQALVQNGAAKMIVDKVLTGAELIDDIEALYKNQEELDNMARQSLALGRPQAAQDIAKLALSIAKK